MSEETKKTPYPEETAVSSSAPKEPEKKPHKKKLIIIIAAAAAAVILAIVLIVVFTSGSSTEDAEDYEYIDVSAVNYYSGVVEPQQTANIAKDSERTVKEVFVKVGDSVKKGDELFSYDSEEAANKLAKAQIEYESLQNNILEYETSISQLSRQRSEADANQQLEYTTQIQEKESAKSQAELDLRIKQVEIDNYQKNVDNAVVTSPIDGVIKAVNTGDDASSGAFITVLMNGSFRIKGTVDETNVRSLSQDMEVIVHSRLDENKTWKGTITKVDTSDTADNSKNNSDMYGSGSGEGASKYYFYVNLDSSEDLLMGEHVFIEPVYDDGADEEMPADEGFDADAAADTPADQAAEN